MVLLKSTVVVLLAVACVSAASTIVAKQSPDHAEQNVDLSAESTKSLPSGNSTTLPTPTQNPNSTTTTAPPTTTTTTTPKPTSTTTNTTPTTTTTTTLSPTTSTTPKSTTLAPTTPTPSTTPSPNTTTTALPPTPEPSPARSWDGPSFLGGMVLAFGIVAVGFVGYRFFYLGRGGAYHTL